MHAEKSEFADQIITVNFRGNGASGTLCGEHQIKVDDWWDHLTGSSWMRADGNFAALMYGLRSGFSGIPIDDEVLYGHDVNSHRGHLFHLSEVVNTRVP